MTYRLIIFLGFISISTLGFAQAQKNNSVYYFKLGVYEIENDSNELPVIFSFIEDNIIGHQSFPWYDKFTEIYIETNGLKLDSVCLKIEDFERRFSKPYKDPLLIPFKDLKEGIVKIGNTTILKIVEIKIIRGKNLRVYRRQKRRLDIMRKRRKEILFKDVN